VIVSSTSDLLVFASAQPPKKDDKGGKSKPAKEGGGGKAKKKKWSKGKQKEKLNAAVFFDKNLYEKLKKEVPNYKLITPSIIAERMRCNVSMARRAINDLLLKGMIKVIAKHQKQSIYTRALAGAE
jgi:small subunit ribosomal protein S25e